jgi:hypothetical protein
MVWSKARAGCSIGDAGDTAGAPGIEDRGHCLADLNELFLRPWLTTTLTWENPLNQPRNV